MDAVLCKGCAVLCKGCAVDAVLCEGCAVCKSWLFTARGAVVWEGHSVIVTDGESIAQHIEVRQTILWALFTPMLA